MAHGIVRQVIFRDDSDRDDFVGRLGTIDMAGAFHAYTGALLPNRFHLLVRTAQQPLTELLGVRPESAYRAAR